MQEIIQVQVSVFQSMTSDIIIYLDGSYEGLMMQQRETQDDRPIGTQTVCLFWNISSQASTVLAYGFAKVYKLCLVLSEQHYSKRY